MLFKSAFLGNREIIKAYKGNTLFYQKSELPEGYTKVKAIYPSSRASHAYLWVPFSIDSSMDFELSFKADFYRNNLLYFYNGMSSEQAAVLIYGKGTDVGFRISGTAYRSGATIADDADHIIKYEEKKLYLDNTMILDLSSYGDWSAENISLFNYRQTSYALNAGTSWLRDFRVTKNGNTLLHVQPCLDNNDTPCAYAYGLNNTFYNNGSGTYAYEPYE